MKIRSVGAAAAGGLLFGVLALSPVAASAAPLLDMGVATTADSATAQIESARWVCGPYRCWRRPNYFYGPVYRPWGYGWRRPWGYGWRRPWGWGGGWHRGWGWRRGW